MPIALDNTKIGAVGEYIKEHTGEAANVVVLNTDAGEKLYFVAETKGTDVVVDL